VSLELSTEVLNRRGFDTDADGEVPTVSEHVNVRGHVDPVSVSQGLYQTIRATERHVNGAGVILQREGGTPTPPSSFMLTRTRQMDHTLECHQFQIGGVGRGAEAPDRHLTPRLGGDHQKDAQQSSSHRSPGMFLPRFTCSRSSSMDASALVVAVRLKQGVLRVRPRRNRPGRSVPLCIDAYKVNRSIRIDRLPEEP
jgi:hypothetical protein